MMSAGAAVAGGAATARRGLVALAIAAVLVAAALSATAAAAGGGRDWVESTLQRMTLREKVGQLLMVQVYGRSVRDPAFAETNLAKGRGARDMAAAIERYHLGGLILFNFNANIPVPLDAR